MSFVKASEMPKSRGGWRGKTMPHYTLTEEGLNKPAALIFDSKELKPADVVKKAWDFIKANAKKEMKKVE